MPLTVAPLHDPVQDSELGFYLVTFDNSYPANGYAVSAASFSRSDIYGMLPSQQGTANRIVTWDLSVGAGDGRLRIWTALGTEAVTSSDQSTISCVVLVLGPHK